MYPKLTLEQRFWSKVDPCRTDGCILFIGYCDPQGYGRISINNIPVLAHHVTAGKPPVGLVWDHVWPTCIHRNCINTEHLEAVTQAVNAQRALRHGPLKGSHHANKRVPPTHCKHGHAFDEANTYWLNGYRSCRECHRLRERARHHG